MILELSFTASLLAFIIIERSASALGLLVFRLLYPGSGEQLQSYAGVQVLGAGASFVASVASAAGRSVVQACASLLSYVFWAFALSVLFGGVYVLMAYYPAELLDIVGYWNSTLGPLYEMVLLSPLRVLNVVFSSVVPLWNAFFNVLSRVLYEVVVRTAIRDRENIAQLGIGISRFVSSTVTSLGDYVTGAAEFSCTSPPTSACYDVGGGVLDLLTPMSHMRGIAVSVSGIFSGLCQYLSGPVGIVLYPFLDINLAKAVHNIGNGILFPFFQMPGISSRRCKDSGGDLLMCLPDVEPGLNMLVSGLRSLGLVLDNWLDASSIIIQVSLGFDPGLRCDQVPLALTPLNRSESLFGSNQTVVVGLTEGLYAITDGDSAQYFNHYNSVSSMLSPGVWPIPIEPSFGVASVRYFFSDGESDDEGEPRTTMMGCRCDDVDGRMRILCAFALYGETLLRESLDPAQDLTFEVQFHQRSTAGQMRCVEAEISVQSVRWPVRRFTTAFQEEADMDDTCTSRRTCTQVDATVWVQPKCSSMRGANMPICREGNNLASCFP